MNNDFGVDQLFVISRSGSGHVLRFDISFGILSNKPETEIWKPIRGLREFSCVAFKHYVFIFGGYSVKLNRCVEHFRRYDVHTCEWEEMPPMRIGRRMCTVAIFKNEIIICGGFKTNNKLLSACEIFNIQRRKWRKCSSLKKPKADQQLLVIGDALIGLGGVQQVTHKGELVFCASDGISEYNNMVSGWQTLDENLPLILGKPVYLHSVVAVESKIFIIGGLKTVIDNSGELSEVINDKVESLSLGNTQINSLNKNDIKGWISPWDRSMKSPSIARYGAAAVLIGHGIYLIGGSAEGHPNGVSTVERFHFNTSCWTNEFDIKEEGDLSMICAVKVYGSKYKLPVRTKNVSNSVASVSYQSEDDEQECVGVHSCYRVGWILW